LTHLLFFGEAADHPVLEWTRAALAPFVVPAAVRLAWPRRFALRTIGQLGVEYPTGALAVEGRPALRGRPRPGARMPDAPLVRNGMPYRLHVALATPRFHLLLCGPPHHWDAHRAESLQECLGGFLVVHQVSADPVPDVLHDPDGVLLGRLGAHPHAQYLIRPNGHVAYRCASTDLDWVERHLATWLPGTVAARPSALGEVVGCAAPVLRGAQRPREAKVLASRGPATSARRRPRTARTSRALPPLAPTP
jgi:hypothetical protein